MIIITLIIALIFGLLFSLTEIAQRKFKLKSALTRPIAHVSSGLLSAALPLWLDQKYIIFLGILFFVVLAISKRVKIFQAIHGVDRKTWGELFFPISVFSAAILFLPHNKDFYFYSMLAMTLADTSANLAGLFFSHQKTKLGKSLGGTLAFIIVAFIIGLIFISPVKAIEMAIFLALVEHVSPYGLDNLTIVLGAGLLLL